MKYVLRVPAVVLSALFVPSLKGCAERLRRYLRAGDRLP